MTDRIAHATGLYLPSAASVEDRYEGVVRSVSNIAFPEYFWVDFKAEIRHPGGLVHADAALVARNYSRWVVVEVERVEHSWEDHIRPQLSKLIDGWFNGSHRKRLVDRGRALDKKRIADLDIYHPDIALIINAAPQHVRRWCATNGVLCIEAVPYFAQNNEVAVGISGDELPPIAPTEQRLVGQAEIAKYAVDVAMFEYVAANEFTEQAAAFRAVLGEREVEAVAYGDGNRGFAVSCSARVVRELLGGSESVDLIRRQDGVIAIQPR